MPKRIQMTRQKPWRADNPDAVIVARPSKWGNPFTVGGEYVTTDFLGGDIGVLTIGSRQEAAGAFNAWIAGEFFVTDFEPQREWIIEHIEELRGRDLACWCPLELSEDGFKQCHADVHLELANGGA